MHRTRRWNAARLRIRSRSLDNPLVIFVETFFSLVTFTLGHCLSAADLRSAARKGIERLPVALHPSQCKGTSLRCVWCIPVNSWCSYKGTGPATFFYQYHLLYSALYMYERTACNNHTRACVCLLECVCVCVSVCMGVCVCE